ncbi:MAG: adenylosuccinate lyase [Deltaproteobacteria bacterium]|nr:adenylosuccinate lyase [Deltaproteobacteria bacterium]
MIPRYRTAKMEAIWSEDATFRRWTAVEIAACEAWHARGEIPDAEMSVIRTRASHQSAARVAELEAVTHHDVVAFVRAVGEAVGEPARRHLHRGLTSSDVVDSALALGMKASLEVVLDGVGALQAAVGHRAREFKNTLCVGRTHGVHAEPTTFGLRLAGFFTELQRNRERLTAATQQIAFGKLSGAVGTFSQTDPAFEAFVLGKLGLACEPVATQVVPRDRHAAVMCALAILGASLERFATDLRSLQRTEIREVEEPFAEGQTGSSAMPHKRNPISGERVVGLARLLRGYALSALEDVSLWHERDISHSSVERVIVPDAFHVADYMLAILLATVAKLRVYPERMLENLQLSRGLVSSQTVLHALLAKGLDRQRAYGAVQRAAMAVWERRQQDFRAALGAEAEVTATLTPAELEAALAFEPHLRHVDALFSRAGL